MFHIVELNYYLLYINHLDVINSILEKQFFFNKRFIYGFIYIYVSTNNNIQQTNNIMVLKNN